MAWLRIDDRVRTHPKIAQAGPVAAWLWFCGLCYCREHLLDGVIPKYVVRGLAAVPNPDRQAKRLVDVGLWHDRGDAYEIHDFLDWNPSRQDVEASKEWDRRRKELYADPKLIQDIRQRDGDDCRYCGKTVNWRDRRGPMGGQFDHVVPRGPNTLENIVVACRGCNIAKNGRTPAEAGMALREPKNQLQSQIRTSSESKERTGSPSRARAGDAGLGSSLGIALQEESPRETTDDEATAAGAFVHAYERLYAKHRLGAAYQRKPVKDYEHAVALIRAYPDTARLARMAEIYLLRDDRDVEGKVRTIGEFRHMAPWCDTRLRSAGQ